MNIEEFLEGKVPNLDQYAELVSCFERLTCDLLYKLILSYPNMHWSLKNVANDQLKIKIREKIDHCFNENTLKDLTNKLI